MKKRRKRLRTLCTVMLVISLTITGLNHGVANREVKAETAQANKTETEAETKEAEVVKELTDKRTENSNTYQLSDGSKKVEIFSEDIRYQENGKWTDYDTSLKKISKSEKKELGKIVENNEENKYVAVNAKGDSRQYFPKTLGEESAVVMENGKYSLSFAPIIEEKEENIKVENNITDEKENARILEPEIKEDIITYSSEETDITYQYISLTDGVKENIILDSKPDTNEFKFKINIQKIKMELLEGYGGINLKDTKTGKVIGCILPPNITDAEGNTDYENVEYQIETEKEETILKLVVKKEYLEKEDLKYPVIIDPTPVWFHNKLSTAMVNDVIGDYNLHNEELQVSNKAGERGMSYISKYRTYLDTSKIATGECFVQGPGNISGKYIEKATLSITEATTYYPKGTIEIRKPKTTWDASTITWDTQPEVGELIVSFESTGTEGTIHNLDVTQWAQNIAEGAVEDTGLVFLAPQEQTGITFKGPEVTHQNYMWISITYRDMSQYDATVQMSAEYDEESGNIEIKVEDYDQSNVEKTVTGYNIFKRNGESDKFVCVASARDVTKGTGVKAVGIDSTADFRVCVSYSDGTVMPSNIVTMEKSTEVITDDAGEESEVVSYEQTTMDTDEDGLEDGYEIWDFKTKWNEKDDEGKYVLDSDGDGFPDSYEVFMLGTDPAVANEEGKDSDGDGLSDLEEYKKGTDSYLKDSDFDGINDSEDTQPLITNNSLANNVEADVHIGIYSKLTEEVKEDSKVSYIENIYSGNVQQEYTQYSDDKGNKLRKYFYDSSGNLSAILENDGSSSEIIATYYYDENGNIKNICSQDTFYMFSYKDNVLESVKVGDNEIISYDYNTIIDATEEAWTIGKVISQKEEIINYGNGDKIKNVTIQKVKAKNDGTDENNVSEFLTETTISTYQGEDNTLIYEVVYNDRNEIIKCVNYVAGNDNAITYEYEKNDSGVSVTQLGDFSISDSSSEEDSKTVNIRTYNFKDFKGNTQEMSLRTQDTVNDAVIKTDSDLISGDKITNESDNDTGITTNILRSVDGERTIYQTQEALNNKVLDYKIDGKKDYIYSYTYNSRNQIEKVSLGGKVICEYEYDINGRLISEIDRNINDKKIYYYGNSGNIEKVWYCSIYEDGSISTTPHNVKSFQYGNEQWGDQLTSMNGKTFECDISGNYIKYRDNMTLEWSQGNKLTKATVGNEVIEFDYDVNGNRTRKESEDIRNLYQYDGDMLIREKVFYKQSNDEYDIWYIYDGTGNCIGYKIYEQQENNTVTHNVYYEKDAYDNVIGLLDADGNEIATYSYDAWGNITTTEHNATYQKEIDLNHLKYRGYYMDDEIGFYYLMTRYYDPVTYRFISPDNVKTLNNVSEKMFENNLYIYCNSDPVNYSDYNGQWYYSIRAYIEGESGRNLELMGLNYSKNKTAKQVANFLQKQYENNSKYLTKNNGNKIFHGYVKNQRSSKYKGMKYGVADVEKMGCVPIAIYNVFKMTGKKNFLPTVILECCLNGMDERLYGGTKPENIAKYLRGREKQDNIQWAKVNSYNMLQIFQGFYDYFILILDYGNSMHAIAVKRIKGGYMAYNYGDTDKGNLKGNETTGKGKNKRVIVKTGKTLLNILPNSQTYYLKCAYMIKKK